MRRKLGLIRVEGRSGSRTDGRRREVRSMDERFGNAGHDTITSVHIQSPSSVCVCIERGASQNAAYIIERGDLKAKDRGFAMVLCIAAWRLAVCLAPS